MVAATENCISQSKTKKKKDIKRKRRRNNKCRNLSIVNNGIRNSGTVVSISISEKNNVGQRPAVSRKIKARQAKRYAMNSSCRRRVGVFYRKYNTGTAANYSANSTLLRCYNYKITFSKINVQRKITFASYVTRQTRCCRVDLRKKY